MTRDYDERVFGGLMKDYLALICGSPGTLDSTWQYLGTRISIMIPRDRINFYTELCVNKYRLINLLMPKIVRSKYEPQYRANTEASRHKSHGIFQENQQPYMVLPIEQHGLVLRTVVATTFSVYPLACSNTTPRGPGVSERKNWHLHG